MATLAPAYAPRRPTETALYGIVRDNLETFLRWARETYAKPLPRYVEQELRAYLRCDVFAHGFVHCRCEDCGHGRERAQLAIALYRGTLAMLPASEDEGDGSSSDTGNVGAPPRSAFAVERDGFNLHAGVRIEAGDDLGRERLCRYGARPPLSRERLRLLSGGRVAYRVKYVSRGRAKHRVMTSIELLARLSALLPPPRDPLTRYHGVLAGRSAWRREIVPRAPARSDEVTAMAVANRRCSSATGTRDQPVGKRTGARARTASTGRDGHESRHRPRRATVRRWLARPGSTGRQQPAATGPSSALAPERDGLPHVEFLAPYTLGVRHW